MEYDLTESQRHWQGVAERVRREVLAERATAVDREGIFPRQNFNDLAAAGLMGLTVSEELGGPDGDILTIALVNEQLAMACASTAMCFHMHSAASYLICEVAEGDQVDRFIEPILAGSHISTYAISEPGSGSRWWHMESNVEPAPGGYHLQSFKSWSTSAGEADSYIVPVRASAESPNNEYTLLLVERDTENLKPIGDWDAMGMRGNQSTPIHFDGCFVPEGNRLGEAAFGFPLLMAHGLPVFQIGLAAVYLGIAQAAFDFAVAHVSKRVHADTNLPLSKVETVQLYVADMKLRLEQTRSFVYGVARYVDRLSRKHGDMVEVIDDTDFLQAVAQVKVAACRASSAVTNIALQVCGGTGYSRGHALERYYRDSRAGSLMGPADDVLRVLIGQRALGLPYPWE